MLFLVVAAVFSFLFYLSLDHDINMFKMLRSLPREILTLHFHCKTLHTSIASAVISSY